MAQIILHLSDDLAKRLAPFRDRLPELLERGLQDMIQSSSRHTEAEALRQRLAVMQSLHRLRAEIQSKKGVYEGDLLAEVRLARESNCFENLDSAL